MSSTVSEAMQNAPISEIMNWSATDVELSERLGGLHVVAVPAKKSALPVGGSGSAGVPAGTAPGSAGVGGGAVIFYCRSLQPIQPWHHSECHIAEWDNEGHWLIIAPDPQSISAEI